MTALNKAILINILLLLCAILGLYWLIYGETNGQLSSLWQHDPQNSLTQLVVFYNLLPQFVMAFLVGGSLAISTALLQRITHNPLAADSTLAISGGAYLALLLVTLFMPSLLLWLNSAVIALVGALATLLIVFSLSYKQQFLPIRMLLAGLILNLYLGTLATVLIIFHPEAAKAIFQWEAGSLVQDSWHDVYQILFISLVALMLLRYLIRSLHIMQLGDTQAKSLGVSVKAIRLLCLVIVAYLCATAVSLVGMIGFIGLAAATIINQLSINNIKHKLLLTYFTGGGLLLCTDTFLTIIQQYTAMYLPVGAVTAFIGAPLLLYLIFKALPRPTNRVSTPSLLPAHCMTNRHLFTAFLILSTMLALLIVMSLCVSNTENGFVWMGWHNALIEIKLPRVLTAIACGCMLSLCGVLLQNMTHNPLASPELLGISSGAAIAVILAVLLGAIDSLPLWLYGIIGAFITFVFITLINYKNQFQPEKVILTGIAISALLAALIRLFLVNADLRVQSLLVWLSGSTYASQLPHSLVAVLVAGAMLLITLLFNRPLSLLLLPSAIATSLGLNINVTRLILMTLSTIMITFSTLQIGPLSFVGLVVPLLTRMLGFTGGKSLLIVAALMGSTLMLFADWLGSHILFPYEIPAGLVATLIGGLAFLILMKRV